MLKSFIFILEKKVHVTLVQVFPPDHHGYVSLGGRVDVTKSAVETADFVVAHININMPRIHGDGILHIDDIDYAIEANTELYSPKLTEPSAEETAIGKNVASLVEDDATLQFGIGSIPNAFCRELRHHKNLGLHSEIWCDGAFHLLKDEVIDKSRNKFHREKETSTIMIGPKEMYDFENDNMTVLNLEASYINFSIYIMKNPKVPAINSAV